jgi:glycosyltransferase involved in cell wall biosynthesis
MRILHVLGKLDRGGVETWLVQVLRHINRQKYQMDFLVHTTAPGAYDQEVQALGARIIPCLSPSNPLQYAFNFHRALNQYGPYDVVHSHVHHYSGYVLMLAAMAGVPVRIAQSHTAAPEQSAGVVRRTYLKLMRNLIRRHASAGLVVSNLAGNSLMPDWREDASWHLAPYGIDTRPFDVEVDHAQVRAQLGIPLKAPVVGHVGRFVGVKNHKLILRVAEELLKLEPSVVFLLVGDGPLRPEIEGEINRRGLSEHFVMAGLRSNVPEILKGAMDTFLFPSEYEGLPIALMEAELAGLPCLASDVIAPEADLVPGMVSRLPVSASPQKWAEPLYNILESDDIWRVPDDVRRRHSIESSVSRLAALYESGRQAEPAGMIYQSAH